MDYYTRRIMIAKKSYHEIYCDDLLGGMKPMFVFESDQNPTEQEQNHILITLRDNFPGREITVRKQEKTIARPCRDWMSGTEQRITYFIYVYYVDMFCPPRKRPI